MNISCFLGEPPKGHEEFKSMIMGLKHVGWNTLYEKIPIIREDWIRDFWNNATTKKIDNVIRSTIQNK
ncbi:hypothetical protein Hanom_Chr05g00416171 [Helianthus anomalus]